MEGSERLWKKKMVFTDKSYYILYIPIAHLLGQVNIDNYCYFRRLKDRFYSVPYNSKINPLFDIKIEQKSVNQFSFTDRFPFKKGIFPYLHERINFKNFTFSLTAFLQHFVLPCNILFLHASAFIKDNRAYVFCGPSGVGKSTVIKKVSKDNVLSDDITVIGMIGNKFYVYQSPFDHSKYPYRVEKKVLLGKIYFLKQAKNTKFIRLTLFESFNRLFYNTNIIYHRILSKKQKEIKQKKNLCYTSIKEEKKLLKRIFTHLYKLLFNLTLYSKPEELLFTKQITFLKEL